MRRILVQNISFFIFVGQYYCDYTLEEHCYVILIKKDYKLFNSFVMFVYTKPTMAMETTPNHGCQETLALPYLFSHFCKSQDPFLVSDVSIMFWTLWQNPPRSVPSATTNFE